MSRLYLPTLLLLFVVLQGAVFNFIPIALIDDGWIFVIHVAFVFLILFSLFYDLEQTYYAILFAILAGLMIDIVYTSIIGVYMFSYGLVIYFVHGMRKFLHANFYVALLLTILSISLVDTIIYAIYSFIGVSDMEMVDYLLYRLVPTLSINVTIFILFFVLFKKKLVVWSRERFNTKGSS